MEARLTAETLSDESLAAAATELSGLLGTYNKKEYEALKRSHHKDWDFIWLASNMDPNVGRVKMRPLSRKAIALIDQGRAKRLIERHQWMSLPRAIGLIKVLKRYEGGMSIRIQDFLVHYWENDQLQTLHEHRDAFIQRVIDMTPHDNPLSSKQLQAIHRIFPRVRNVMIKSKKKG